MCTSSGPLTEGLSLAFEQEVGARPGVLLAFIILDNPAASLLDMKAVSFVDGQPSFAQYLDAFPFPFYILLRDLASLPATLAGLLRQWFELSAAGVV
jgi:midasin